MDRNVYKATTPTLADKDSQPPLCDAAGNTKVAIADAAGGALTKTDDAALAPGCSFVPMGGIVDDTATDSADEGDGVVARFDAQRCLVVALGKDIRGENATTKRLDVSTPHSTARMTTATTTTHLTGAGRFRGVQVGKSVAAATELGYDNTAASGTVVYSRTGPAVVSDVPPYSCDIPLATGFTVIQSGATDALYHWNANP